VNFIENALSVFSKFQTILHNLSKGVARHGYEKNKTPSENG
jgi:hypothetical protein